MKKLLGRLVRITSDNENYTKYQNKILKIVNVAYNTDEHPGYDDSLKGEALCDFTVMGSGKQVPFSLYEYEFELI